MNIFHPKTGLELHLRPSHLPFIKADLEKLKVQCHYVHLFIERSGINICDPVCENTQFPIDTPLVLRLVKTHMGKCLFSPELKSYLITQ